MTFDKVTKRKQNNVRKVSEYLIICTNFSKQLKIMKNGESRENLVVSKAFTKMISRCILN